MKYLRKIKIFLESIIPGIKNILYFFPVIWNYRWYDFSYFIDIMEKVIEDYAKRYGIESHFIGDEEIQEKAIEILKALREWKEADMYDKKEAPKKKEKFFELLSNNIEEFWD